MLKWIALALLVVLVAVMVWPRGGQATTPAASSPTAQNSTQGLTQNPVQDPAQATVQVPAETSSRIVIQDQSSSASTATDADSGPRARVMSTIEPSRLEPGMVDYVRQDGGQRTLVLTDGSEMVLTDFVQGQLPGEVAERVGYARGR